jgi:HEAT repeat protein
MERVTFPDPKVRTALEKHVAVKINVDREENRAVCERYRPTGGIPSYAIVAPDGTLRRQFTGFREPHAFLDALTSAKPPERRPQLPAGPALDDRIKRNIRTFDKPAPDHAVSRVLEWFGARRQTVGEWVKEQNTALNDLTRIGKPAVPALLHAVEHGSARGAERCAVVLGRIKAPEAKPRLAALLRHKHAHVRIAAVTGLGLYCERAFLPALRERLEDRKEAVRVRMEAVSAMARIARSYGGIDDPAVARALLEATRIDHARLRWECLQALLHIDSPIDLSALFPLMEDRRVGIGGFSEQTVSANACWVFVGRCGHYPVRIDGRELEGYTPKLIAFLKSWYQREKENLVWDPKCKHFRLRKS